MHRHVSRSECGEKKTENKFFEKLEQFKNVVTTLTNQNSIQEETKSRLNPGNACYHSLLLSSGLLSDNTTNKIYITIILPVMLYWHETWSDIFKKSSCLRTVETAPPVIRL